MVRARAGSDRGFTLKVLVLRKKTVFAARSVGSRGRSAVVVAACSFSILLAGATQ